MAVNDINTNKPTLLPYRKPQKSAKSLPLEISGVYKLTKTPSQYELYIITNMRINGKLLLVLYGAKKDGTPVTAPRVLDKRTLQSILLTGDKDKIILRNLSRVQLSDIRLEISKIIMNFRGVIDDA